LEFQEKNAFKSAVSGMILTTRIEALLSMIKLGFALSQTQSGNVLSISLNRVSLHSEEPKKDLIPLT